MKRAVLAALAATIACVPVAWAAGKANTTVTLDDITLATGQTHWAGDLSSPRKGCKDKRLVLIYRVRSGADKKVASTRSFKGLSDNGYYWTYAEQGAAPAGRYYAKVRPTDACRGDRSPTYRFTR